MRCRCAQPDRASAGALTPEIHLARSSLRARLRRRAQRRARSARRPARPGPRDAGRSRRRHRGHGHGRAPPGGRRPGGGRLGRARRRLPSRPASSAGRRWSATPATRPGCEADEARVVAANVDVVIVVRALDMPVRPGRVQQLVALAYASGAEVLFALTKADCHDDVAGAIGEVEAVAPGVPVLAVSAVTGAGIDELVAEIRGRSFVLLGESGAGKSTLVNRLAGEELLATGDVQRSGAGRPHHDAPSAGGAPRASASRSIRRASAAPRSGAPRPTSRRAFADIEALAADAGSATAPTTRSPAARSATPCRPSASRRTGGHCASSACSSAAPTRVSPASGARFADPEPLLPPRQLAVVLRRFKTRPTRPASMLGPRWWGRLTTAATAAPIVLDAHRTGGRLAGRPGRARRCRTRRRRRGRPRGAGGCRGLRSADAARAARRRSGQRDGRDPRLRRLGVGMSDSCAAANRTSLRMFGALIGQFRHARARSVARTASGVASPSTDSP